MSLSKETTTNHKQSEQPFHMRKVNYIRLGVSSLGDLLLALIDFFDNSDEDAKKGNSFNETIMADLASQYEALKNFFDYVSELFDSGSEFTYFITSGPQKYPDIPPYNIRLGDVRVQRIVKTFVERLHYINSKRLFKSDDPDTWDPSRVTIKGSSCDELIAFATELKKFWSIFDGEFTNSFSKAIYHAVEVSKAETNMRNLSSKKEEKKEDPFIEMERKKILKEMFEQEVERRKRQNRGKKNMVLNEDEIWDMVQRRYNLKEKKEKEKLDKQHSTHEQKEVPENIPNVIVDVEPLAIVENMWSKGNPLVEKQIVHQERLTNEINELYNSKLEKTAKFLARKENSEGLVSRFLESDSSLTPLELEVIKKIIYQSKIEFDSRDQKSEKKSQKKPQKKSRNNKKVDPVKQNDQVENKVISSDICPDNSGEWTKVGERKRTPKGKNFHQQRKNRRHL